MVVTSPSTKPIEYRYGGGVAVVVVEVERVVTSPSTKPIPHWNVNVEVEVEVV